MVLGGCKAGVTECRLWLEPDATGFGDPVVQLAPPLISTRADIDFMVGTMREVFTGAVKFI